MARADHPIHDFILDQARPVAESVLLDIGCGTGPTLVAAWQREQTLRMVGIDRKPEFLGQAMAALRQVCAAAGLLQADMDRGLPLADGSVDVIVCHNVLEYLGRPDSLMAEAARVLRPGGRAVWSHVDFAGIILNVADAVLNGRVLDVHATYVPRWMGNADGRMGRKLAGLVRRSPLIVESVDVRTVVATGLEGDARWRIDQILAVIRPAADRGEIDLTPDDVDRWVHDLERAAAVGDFVFVEPTFVVVSHRP